MALTIHYKVNKSADCRVAIKFDNRKKVTLYIRSKGIKNAIENSTAFFRNRFNPYFFSSSSITFFIAENSS